MRHDIYQIDAELKLATKAKDASPQDKASATKIRADLRKAVEYAPVWVRMLSALCLGAGTMIGYRRIVRTIGERIGKEHMNPGQGASAELVGAALIGTAGFSGLPVSTTHIIASGVAGTMASSGAGIQMGHAALHRHRLGADPCRRDGFDLGGIVLCSGRIIEPRAIISAVPKDSMCLRDLLSGATVAGDKLIRAIIYLSQ